MCLTLCYTLITSFLVPFHVLNFLVSLLTHFNLTCTIAKRYNQSILKEISPGCSLEGLMLKLKLQYFGHLMRRADSFEKTLMLEKIEGRRRRGQQRIRWLDCITDLMEMGLRELRSWWWTGRPGVLRFMGSQTVGHDWVTELNWTEVALKKNF